ncbi:hypothetical protein niasHS_015178 [Heterodera schachtii]|uniref:Uncharacterized protein n=1 Tax=Heterodera schachtii TaxID=97005 RepID=A0ABD2IDX2_HETSC
MFPHNLAFFGALSLFVFVFGCFADNFVVQLKPTLSDGTHIYRVAVTCQNKFTETKRSEKTMDKAMDNYDQIEYELEKCPVDLRIFVQIINENSIVWEKHFKKTIIREEVNRATQQIAFGNYFKLAILPSLANSNGIYRVLINCAGRGLADFTSFTQSEMVVVMNAEEPKCNENKFDISIWKMKKDQIKNKKLMAIETQNKTKKGVEIPTNGTYRFNFENPTLNKLEISNLEEKELPSPNKTPKRKKPSAEATANKERELQQMASQNESPKGTNQKEANNREKKMRQCSNAGGISLQKKTPRESENSEEKQKQISSNFYGNSLFPQNVQNKATGSEWRKEKSQRNGQEATDNKQKQSSPTLFAPQTENSESEERKELERMGRQIAKLRSEVETIKSKMNKMANDFKKTMMELKDFMERIFDDENEKSEKK